MDRHEDAKERLIPALRTAALAVALVALVAVIAPRIASSGGTGESPGGSPASSTSLPAESILPGGASTTTSPVALSTTTSSPPITPPGPEFTGSVTLEVAGVADAEGGELPAVLAGGEALEWRFRVVNTGEETLWGIYVYFEGFGPVPCGAHRLEPGEATDCVARAAACAAAQPAQAWVTAWTETRMVGDQLSRRLPFESG